MTAVKRMAPTNDFLKMSFKDRNCEVEEYEDCRTRNLLKQCHLHTKEPKQRSSFQDCLEKYASGTFNCSVACEGIYADVAWIDVELLKKKPRTGNGVELNREKLFQIIQEYRDKKAKFVKNFAFNATKYPFGRFLLNMLDLLQYLSDDFLSRGGVG